MKRRSAVIVGFIHSLDEAFPTRWNDGRNSGEATVSDTQTGTVFDALESGLRAARELIDSK